MNESKYTTQQNNKKEKDPFLEDAREGWEQFPKARFTWLKTKTHFSIFLFGKSWMWLPAGTKWMIGSIATAATVSVITVSTILFQKAPDSFFLQEAVHQEQEQNLQRPTFIPIDAESDEDSEETIIAINEQDDNNTYDISGYGYTDEDAANKKASVDRMASQNINSIIDSPQMNTLSPALPWLSVHDYKVIDYDVLRADITISDEVIHTGLSSRFATASESKQDNVKKSVDKTDVIQVDTISYKEYLASALLMIKQQNYLDAENKLKILLNLYPKDENVIFYMGYMYYEQGSFVMAIPWFEKAMNSPLMAFAKDAEWLKAKSLLSIGQTKEACKLFKVIVSKNNIHSIDARKLLKLHDNN